MADKLGPGRLTLGEIGDAAEFGALCTSVTIEPEDEDGETTPVLSGGDVVDEGTQSYNLTGSVFQEFNMTGLVAWSKEHHGQVMPFEFVPSTAGQLKVTGQVRVKRLAIGGDVKTRNQSEFTFPGVGDYDLETYTPEG